MFTIYEGLERIIKHLTAIRLDAQRFDEGNALAGTRVTKMLMAVIKETKALRKACFTIRAARKEKKNG
jgi:hypothetical protein